ncbi:SRPBCC family protein [Streptomyces sp. NPDC049590]|uniref:SRPBCC family protein n=1 Tax=Streptomyces sp. NPDC049590 TaxID=3154834 RepID=UPI00342CC40E
MEHQVFVQASPDRLGAALTDPARVARAVPGLQQDAGAEPLTGRLKLRVGGHSVTYRGTARVTPRADGTYAVEAAAGEARGTGSAELSLTLRLTAAEGGCTVTAEGTATATGRLAELPAESVTSATTRLLTRFLESLAAEEPGEGEESVAAEESVGEGDQSSGADEPSEPDEGEGVGVAADASRPSVFDTEVPPPSLDRDADDDAEDSGTGTEETEGTKGTEGTEGTEAEGPGAEDSAPRDPGPLAEDFAGSGEPPAEAAHARRTMIGRSAEEVDHAPPRGRYAPVPAPQTVVGNQALRWAAPAAALALASAVVVTRALRRRR